MSFYHPDVHSAGAENFIKQHVGQLYISDWAKVEITSALGIQVRRGAISEALAQQILKTFKTHCASGFYTQLSLDQSHFFEAEHCLQTLKRKLRSADALHLAAAKLAKLHMVTLDQDLAAAAQDEGLALGQV
jgi:predicted nucleic acid-binding protein